MSPTLDSRKAGVRNEQLVLKLLRERGPLSQKQLCEHTALGSSTASTIVSRLRDKGLVSEAPGTSAARGPKPVMLRINPDGRFLIGAELHPSTLRIVIFDYLLEPVAEAELPLRSRDVEYVATLLTVQVMKLLTRNDLEPADVEGLGVTVSGSVSPAGTVELSSTMGWRQAPLSSLLAEHFSFPVHVFTTRVRLLAEMAIEPGPTVRNALYLNVADGVGANVILDGHLLHGASNRAGELGHTIVDPDGPVCGCGHTGCLEALTSGPALAGRIRDDLSRGMGSMLAESAPLASTDRELIGEWGRAIAAGDAYALELQDFAVGHLSTALATAINLYDPQWIFLAGYVSEQCFDALARAVRASLETHVYDGPTRALTIRPALAGRNRYTKGAAISMLAELAQAWT